MYVYVYIYIYIYREREKDIIIHIYIYIYIYIYEHLCIYIYIHTHIYTHEHVYIYIYIPMCMKMFAKRYNIIHKMLQDAGSCIPLVCGLGKVSRLPYRRLWKRTPPENKMRGKISFKDTKSGAGEQFFSAAGLHGQGSRKRSVCFTDTGMMYMSRSDLNTVHEQT